MSTPTTTTITFSNDRHIITWVVERSTKRIAASEPDDQNYVDCHVVDELADLKPGDCCTYTLPGGLRKIYLSIPIKRIEHHG